MTTFSSMASRATGPLQDLIASPRAGAAASGLRLSDEDILAEFESLYDPVTGAWRLPGLFVDGECYEPGVSERWRHYQPHYGPIELAVGHLFGSLVLLYEPTAVLETGTNLGYSGARIANALRQLGGERMLYTIDPVPCDHLFNAMACRDRVTYLQGVSQEVRIPEGVSFDMLFLDSDHRYTTIARELERFEPLLVEGGVMVLHDSVFFDGVALAVRQLMRSDRFELVTLRTPRKHGRPSRCPGVTIVRKKRHAMLPDERIRMDVSLDECEVDLNASRVGDLSWLVDR